MEKQNFSETKPYLKRMKYCTMQSYYESNTTYWSMKSKKIFYFAETSGPGLMIFEVTEHTRITVSECCCKFQFVDLFKRSVLDLMGVYF